MDRREGESGGGFGVGVGVRAALGGVLMGLANLVPGISGGTMLLASGIYPRFVRAVADVTTLRFRFAGLAVLGTVVVSALVAIVLLAGPVKDQVVERRWVMYSLFIGLTLGGVPIVWRMVRPMTASAWMGAVLGLLAMVVLALVQAEGAVGAAVGGGSFVMLLVAGVAAASAMILPGVSGGYLLLVLGQYVAILASIDRVKEGLRAGDVGAVMGEWSVVVPVGIGVVVGVAGVSNLLGWLLRRHEKTTLGVLLGLLVGAVAGLWPFQEGVPPEAGETLKGVVLTEASAALVEPEDWPLRYFGPSAGQVAGSGALVVTGFLVTVGIARAGRERRGGGQAREGSGVTRER